MDMFAAFVRALTEALDDHDVTAEDLARRVHLSRFHFDRVIAATAGEAPAAFRRRILLERAAYRLATSRLTILDVAVEAGYSSHEAFTRAFTRAYGTTPARWRRHPTRFLLDAPSHAHFHPPAGLRLPAPTEVTTMDLVLAMLRHHVWVTGQMLDRAAALDDEALDRPIAMSVPGVDADPTLRSLLARLVGQLEMWAPWLGRSAAPDVAEPAKADAALAGLEYDIAGERGATVAQLRERLSRVGPDFLARIGETAAQGRLAEAVMCPGEPVEVYTVGGVVAHVLTYAAHRRTLVAGALHAAGAAALDDDPIRWVTTAAT